MDAITEKIKEMIKNNIFMENDDVEIREETNLFNDLSMDSIKLLETISEIEEEFNIVFDDDELDIENIAVFSKLCNYVKDKVGK